LSPSHNHSAIRLTGRTGLYAPAFARREQGTLERLKAVRAELIDPGIAGHNGRIVKTTGDGLLVEFGSTVDALHCAREIQDKLGERNVGLAPESCIATFALDREERRRAQLVM
jgi:adenylate cyclase